MKGRLDFSGKYPKNIELPRIFWQLHNVLNSVYKTYDTAVQTFQAKKRSQGVSGKKLIILGVQGVCLGCY